MSDYNYIVYTQQCFRVHNGTSRCVQGPLGTCTSFCVRRGPRTEICHLCMCTEIGVQNELLSVCKSKMVCVFIHKSCCVCIDYQCVYTPDRGALYAKVCPRCTHKWVVCTVYTWSNTCTHTTSTRWVPIHEALWRPRDRGFGNNKETGRGGGGLQKKHRVRVGRQAS